MIKEVWYKMKIEGLKEDDCPEFLVLYSTRREKEDILKMATNTHKTVGKKDNSFLSDFDTRKSGELMIKKSIKDWKGLKNKHLSHIYDTTPDFSDKWDYKGDKKVDTEIKFTENLKREFSEVYDSDIIINFLNPAMDFIDDLNRTEKEKELKN